MGLGGTARKLQKVVEMADELYAKLNDLREELTKVRNSIDETNQRVSNIEDELEEQHALLEQIAAANGIEIQESGTEDAVADESAAEDEE